MSIHQLKKGQKVWYRGGFGIDAPVKGILGYDWRTTRRWQPIWDVTIVDDAGNEIDSRWGYEDQFEARS